jgi:hypothetical protein
MIVWHYVKLIQSTDPNSDNEYFAVPNTEQQSQFAYSTTSNSNYRSNAPQSNFQKVDGTLMCGSEVVSNDPSLELTDCSFMNNREIKLYCPGSYRDDNWLYIAPSESCLGWFSIDVNSIKTLSSLYFADRDNVYTAINGIDTNAIKIVSTDPETFKVLSDGFASASEKLLFAYNLMGRSGSPVIPDADPSTFSIINSYYAKDSKQVYFIRPPKHEGFPEVTVASAIDAQTASILSTEWPELIADDTNVYLYGLAEQGIDARTFRISSTTGDAAIATDNLREYFIKRSNDDTRLVQISVR